MATPYLELVVLVALLCSLFYRLLPAYALLWSSLLLVASACSLGLFIVQQVRQYLGPEALGCAPYADVWCFVHLAYHKKRPNLISWGILSGEQMTEAVMRHQEWQHLPIGAACTGQRLLLRDVTIPQSEKSSALLDYELGYQYPWFGDEWMRTEGTIVKDASQSALQLVNLALIRRAEYEYQLEEYRHFGLYPQALRLRSLAIWHCARFLDRGDIDLLAIGFERDGIYCASFGSGTMLFHFFVPKFVPIEEVTKDAPEESKTLDELYTALCEASSQKSFVLRRVIIYGSNVPGNSALPGFMERLMAKRLISSKAELSTAEDIFAAIFGASPISAEEAALLLVPLGLALGELDHGL